MNGNIATIDGNLNDKKPSFFKSAIEITLQNVDEKRFITGKATKPEQQLKSTGMRFVLMKTLIPYNQIVKSDHSFAAPVYERR